MRFIITQMWLSLIFNVGFGPFALLRRNHVREVTLHRTILILNPDPLLRIERFVASGESTLHLLRSFGINPLVLSYRL